MNSDSSDDEDDSVSIAGKEKAITQTNRIDKLLDAFVSSRKSPSDNSVADLSSSELRELRESLEDGLRHRSQTCLICIETSKRTEAVWSCVCCYTVFHLVCIQSWARHGLSEDALRSSDDGSGNGDLEKACWYCPKCRNEYSRKECPSVYRCFCGQVVNPKADPWLLPHSCGQICSRKLTGCDHTCLLLCHPGPCPPCPKTIMVSCHCRKMPATMRRCGQKSWSCGRECGRKLSCGVHKCKDTCHAGQCDPCDAVSQRPCLCGRRNEKRPCAEGAWQCDTICGRRLQCNRHTCQKMCHSGECPPCAGNETGNVCPCGKTVYSGIDSITCIDELVPCGDTCGKLLDCGIHNCFDRCHKGECSSCTQLRQKQCRCGLKEKLVPCGKEYLCDVKCKQKRQCGRHLCNRRCCDGRCQPCEQVCGRTLQCGKHKCQMPCHRGLCYPCILTAEVTCRCGLTKIKVPCGAERRTKPPRCRNQCTISPDCHHEKRDAHSCHFGDCPPCRQICSKQSEMCGHCCAAVCHSAVLIDVNADAAKRPASSPLEKHQPKFVRTALPCPPCSHPIAVTCQGGHETGRFPCSEARSYSCGRKCGRPLACGNHSCSLLCHSREEQACQECVESCSLPRPDECPHGCLKQCHPSPCPPCRQMLRKACHCGLNQMYIPCLDWNNSSDDQRRVMLACGNACPKQLSCGHQCSLQCHDGPCSSPDNCERKVTVRCPCGRQSTKGACSKLRQRSRTALECNQDCKKVPDSAKESTMEQTVSHESEQTKTVTLGPRRRRKQKCHSKDDDKNGSYLALPLSASIVAFAVGVTVVLAAFVFWWLV